MPSPAIVQFLFNNESVVSSLGGIENVSAVFIESARNYLFRGAFSAAVKGEASACIVGAEINCDDAPFGVGVYLDAVHIAVIGVNVGVAPGV